MELVIDIPTEQYNNIVYEDVDRLRECIKNGTVLPKNHGRLIDADALWDLYHDNDYDFYEAIDSVTTIIEGTEGEE